MERVKINVAVRDIIWDRRIDFLVVVSNSKAFFSGVAVKIRVRPVARRPSWDEGVLMDETAGNGRISVGAA